MIQPILQPIIQPVKIALVCLVLLSGCIIQKPDTRYYTLAVDNETAGSPHSGLRLGIGPIEIPDLIDRREVVIRQNDNRVEILPFDLWGGSLSEDIRNTLASNIAKHIGTDQLIFYPFHGAKIDRQIRVTILELSGIPGKEAQLNALWSVEQTGNKAQAKTNRSHYTVALGENQISAVVAGYSKLLAMLAEDIALHISKRRD